MAGLNDTILRGLNDFDIDVDEVYTLSPCSRRRSDLQSKARVDNAARTSRRAGREWRADNLTPAEAAYVFVRDGGKCRVGLQWYNNNDAKADYCDARDSAFRLQPDHHRSDRCTIDHYDSQTVFPQLRWDLANWQLACHACNRRKAASSATNLGIAPRGETPVFACRNYDYTPYPPRYHTTAVVEEEQVDLLLEMSRLVVGAAFNDEEDTDDSDEEDTDDSDEENVYF